MSLSIYQCAQCGGYADDRNGALTCVNCGELAKAGYPDRDTTPEQRRARELLMYDRTGVSWYRSEPWFLAERPL